MNDVLKSGYLRKQGHFIKSIKSRYFELTLDMLTYKSDKGGEIKGKIPLDSIKSIRIDTSFKIQPCFSIKDKRDKDYKLLPKDSDDLNWWIIYIITALKLRSNNANGYFKQNFNSLYDQYLKLTELIWNHDPINIPFIHEQIKLLRHQDKITAGEVLDMIATISERRKSHALFYLNLVDTFLKSENVTITKEDAIYNTGLRNSLINRGWIKEDLPDEVKYYSSEELLCGFKSSDYRYAIFYDDLPLFKQNMKKVSDLVNPEEYYQLACKYGALNIFKYVMTLQHYQDRYSEYALLGGNREIIEICRKKSKKMVIPTIDELIYYHRNSTLFEFYDYTDFDNLRWKELISSCNFLFLFFKCFKTEDFGKHIGETSALYEACKYMPFSICKMFIDLGCDINSGGRKKKTPLMIAIKHHKFKVVEYLVSLNAPIDTKAKDGTTALMKAAARNDTVVLKYLLDHKAFIEATDNETATPIMHACRNNAYDCVKMLLEKAADPDKLDSNGETPLSICIKNNYLELGRLLIKRSTNVNLKINNGKTPLRIATDLGNQEFINLITSAGGKM